MPSAFHFIDRESLCYCKYYYTLVLAVNKNLLNNFAQLEERVIEPQLSLD
jgi:hypothetical protein